MSNQLEKFGLRPYRKLDGTPLVGAQNRYTIAPGYATAIFQGDLVQPVTSGNIERHAANTSEAVVGVFNGVFYTIQLLKSLRTKITTLVELHQHKAILQPLLLMIQMQYF